MGGKKPTSSSKSWLSTPFSSHDLNATSDDESGSSAADSQVWSAAGRQSDRSGDPVESTGTEITTTGRRSGKMTHRRRSKHAEMATVSVFSGNEVRFKVGPRSAKFSDVLLSRAGKSEAGQLQARKPSLQTGFKKSGSFKVFFLVRGGTLRVKHGFKFHDLLGSPFCSGWISQRPTWKENDSVFLTARALASTA